VDEPPSPSRPLLTTPPPAAVPLQVPTSAGPARVHLSRPVGAIGLVLLGHSAGGGIDAPDLQVLADALPAAGVAVGLVEQPYRAAGRRSPAAAGQLDAAMLAVVAAARQGAEPLVLGGRSSGARVACRTATALAAGAPPLVGADGVLALAFPLRPPWRPEKTRLPELEAVPVPVLVVQGERDHFGRAEDLAAVVPAQARLLAVPGADHGLKRGLDVAEIVSWVLARLHR
jgi:predicted alpha/beta-hydrolase family hydrolase